jgi:SAM-dependent methyltransferase
MMAYAMTDISDAVPTTRRTVLNVGCGPAELQSLHPHFQGPEWAEIRLDIDPATRPDIQSSLTDLSPVPRESVDAIWCSHSLEHLYRHEVPPALDAFLRVLKPGGFLLLTSPDLESVAQLVSAGRIEEPAYISAGGPITALDIIFGHGASLERGNPFMAHRCGFTAGMLGRLLTVAGFVDVGVHRGSAFDLWATAYKPIDKKATDQ